MPIAGWGTPRCAHGASASLLESVPGLRAERLHGAAAVGALLACFAVVLNVGPFAKTSKHEVVQANPAPPPPDLRELFRRAAQQRSVVSTPVPVLVPMLAADVRIETELPPTAAAAQVADRFGLSAEPNFSVVIRA